MISASQSPLSLAEVGSTYIGRPRILSAPRVLAFSGGPLDAPSWPALNLHTDPAKARDAGLEQVIASGTQTEGILIGHLIKLCGPSWYRSGCLEVRFVKSVFVGDAVSPVARLTVRQVDGHRHELKFDVWCRTSDDTDVVVGCASCVWQGAGEGYEHA